MSLLRSGKADGNAKCCVKNWGEVEKGAQAAICVRRSGGRRRTALRRLLLEEGGKRPGSLLRDVTGG